MNSKTTNFNQKSATLINNDNKLINSDENNNILSQTGTQETIQAIKHSNDKVTLAIELDESKDSKSQDLDQNDQLTLPTLITPMEKSNSPNYEDSFNSFNSSLEIPNITEGNLGPSIDTLNLARLKVEPHEMQDLSSVESWSSEDENEPQLYQSKSDINSKREKQKDTSFKELSFNNDKNNKEKTTVGTNTKKSTLLENELNAGFTDLDLVVKMQPNNEKENLVTNSPKKSNLKDSLNIELDKDDKSDNLVDNRLIDFDKRLKLEEMSLKKDNNQQIVSENLILNDLRDLLNKKDIDSDKNEQKDNESHIVENEVKTNFSKVHKFERVSTLDDIELNLNSNNEAFNEDFLTYNEMSFNNNSKNVFDLDDESEDSNIHDLTNLYLDSTPPLPDKDNDKKLPLLPNETILSHEEEDPRDYLKYLQIPVPQECYLPLQCMIYKLVKESKAQAFAFENALWSPTVKYNFIKGWDVWAENVVKTSMSLFGKDGLDLAPEELDFDIDTSLIVIPFHNSANLSKGVLLQLLVSLIKQGQYTNKTRALLNSLRQRFNINYNVFVEELEYPLSKDLFRSNEGINSEQELKKREEENKSSRWAWTSLGALGGGVALAVTGGLAAPLVLPYIGAVFGASTLLAGTSGLALVTSLFGATGAGLAGYRVSQRTASIQDFSFEPILPQHPSSLLTPKPLHVTICISGWINEKDDIVNPWKTLEDGDVNALRFEYHILNRIGKALNSLFTSAAIGVATTELLKRTVLTGLVSAIAWPLTILQAGSVIDNPWSMGLDRAKKAGQILADALINRAQGHRPVTLIGYSLGARVIFHCLEELALRSESDPTIFDIIENAILLGAPVTVDKHRWLTIRPIVGGKLVNGFIQDDWVLSFLHRAMNYGKPVAGNVDLNRYWMRVAVRDPLDDEDDFDKQSYKSVDSEDSESDNHFEASFNADETFQFEKEPLAKSELPNLVESINLTGIVEGHLDYANQMPLILANLGFKVSDIESKLLENDNENVLFEASFAN